MSDLKKILELALSFERSGQEFYKSNMEKVKQALARETFKYLMDMESSHVEFIKKMIEKLKTDETINIEATGEKDEIFKERLKSQALSSNTYSNDLADLSILRMAYLIEKDFVEYYGKASEKIEDDRAKKLLTTLRVWEEGHMELVKRLMERIYEKNALDLGFYPF